MMQQDPALWASRFIVGSVAGGITSALLGPRAGLVAALVAMCAHEKFDQPLADWLRANVSILALS